MGWLVGGGQKNVLHLCLSVPHDLLSGRDA